MTPTELRELADEFERGTARAVASGYEEFGVQFQRERKAIVAALRAAATPSAQGAETTISNLTLDIAESSNLSWQEAKTIATALLGEYRMEPRP